MRVTGWVEMDEFLQFFKSQTMLLFDFLSYKGAQKESRCSK